jgi:hypothetical protein
MAASLPQTWGVVMHDRNNTASMSMHDEAQRLAELGFNVFPISRATKLPITSAEKHPSERPRWGATRDPVRIENYFKKWWPRANIGIETGVGFFVVEADTPEGHPDLKPGDGIAALDKLVADNGGWPDTRMACSPTGSMHYYFRHPEGISIRAGAKLPATAGVEVLGFGNMVVAPPSVAPVAKGSKKLGHYRWLNNLSMAEAPQWLIDLCKRDESERFASSSDDDDEVDIDKACAALDAIPNDFDEDVWWRLMAATIKGSGGDDEAKAAFWRLSDRSQNPAHKGPNARQRWQQRWRAFLRNPPREITAATLYAHADRVAPGWRDESARRVMERAYETVDPPSSSTPPPPPDDDASAADTVAAGPTPAADKNKPDNKKKKTRHGVTVEDFVSYSPQHFYIYKPVREPWVSSGVNANCPPMPDLKPNGDPKLDKDGNPKFIPANVWIDRNRSVQQMSWLPGAPMEIRDRLIKEGVGWIDRRGVTCFNLYQPPDIVPGNPADVGPWLDHVRKIYPDDADHIIKWCAQRVQSPQVKINHALFLGGDQGIGKDTLLEPVKRAVGPHNVQEITAGSIVGRFNGFLKSTILCVNEARDLGESDRFKFYEHLKPIAAAPPTVLRVDEKNLKEHNILNCTGVIITSNHKTDGIYLPASDRRTYVAWSDSKPEDFSESYWKQLWTWYDAGGDRNVAAYLATLDLSSFNPKAPPPKTEAFWAIVDANVAPEESELADVLDFISSPDAVTIDQLIHASASAGLHDANEFLCERKNRRAIPHRMDGCGYVPVRNTSDQQGLWKICGRKTAVYAQKALAIRDQIIAARRLKAEIEAKAEADEAKRTAEAAKRAERGRHG